MATIITRAGKGSPLTNAEVDANFNNLNNAKLELAGGTMTGAIAFAAGQTFPGAGEVTLAGAETLTNKTIAFANNTLTGVAGTTANQTLTNKTIAFANNTLTGVAGTTATQTLTNKTIAFANNTLTGVQPTLVSGTNIKTINGASALGSGNLEVTALPAGSVNQVQINGGGYFSSSPFLTFQNFELSVDQVKVGPGFSRVASNTGVGANVLRGGGTTGTNLTAVGANALSSTSSITGSGNTAIGANAMAYITTGFNNVAVGVGVLAAVGSTAQNCVAIGNSALASVTTGFENTAVGTASQLYLTDGYRNVSLGRSALLNGNRVRENTAVGYEALRNLSNDIVITGNVAVGHQAALNTTTGQENTALGNAALSTNTQGGNNTAIGYNAQASSATVSDTITLGNSAITTLRCQVTTITSLSDARDKTNIVDIPAGLSFVQALRPVAFDWNMRDGGKIGVHEFGFVAQELQAAQAQTGITVPNLVYTDNPEKLEASAGTLIPVLVKAIQELKRQFDDYKASHP
jgi:carbonic anhydrase/acetyltransferase-like protein (isoleucine patch superfamily)